MDGIKELQVRADLSARINELGGSPVLASAKQLANQLRHVAEEGALLGFSLNELALLATEDLR